MRTGLVDLTPLRTSPAYRRLFLGTAGMRFSGQITALAVLYQVFELTGSPLWTGAVGLATALPLIVLGIVGGTLADLFDRRRVVLVTTVGSALTVAGLAVQAVAGIDSPLLVLGLVVVQTSFAGLGVAARRAFVPRLLPLPLVPAGVALDHLTFQAAMLGGPAVAGVLLGAGGLGWAYAVDVVMTLGSLYGVARLPSMPPAARTAAEGVQPVGAWRDGLRATVQGLAFVWRRPVLRGALAVDLAQTLLAMPVALFPLLNAERFAGDPRTLGLFLTAVAVGGTLAGLMSGLITRVARPGLASSLAAGVWGLALAGFGLSDGLVATLAWLALAGAADTVSVISRGALIQLGTPDELRGRVSALEIAIGAGGPGLGNARAGAVADLTSATVSAVTGAVTCVLVVVAVALTHPPLRRWRTDDGPAAAPGA